MNEPKITPEQYAALAGVLELDGCVWSDIGDKLTCLEADAIAAFLRVFGDASTADELLSAHAEGDDEGDQHAAVYESSPRFPGAQFLVGWRYREMDET